MPHADSLTSLSRDEIILLATPRIDCELIMLAENVLQDVPGMSIAAARAPVGSAGGNAGVPGISNGAVRTPVSVAAAGVTVGLWAAVAAVAGVTAD
jgi:hypothetical protein